MKETNTSTLLNISEIPQPFDLATALTYMKENSEFVRCKSSTQDFYMFIDMQKRPAIVNGRRQFITVETISVFNQWGSITTNVNITDMLNEEYWIMRFDENGSPDWSDPNVAEIAETTGSED
ncbi:hypothetical protein [Streptococcus sp. sy004]|uniref:hypothetical protein n=1 Tax=Streptococcus sp. sy004 TaxID=2600149 RepID=UPI0011B5CDE9|nr:hypothetical protein [Streptococcus sp. sy004]TWT12084.1 hypothetical protein FRX54_00715 [Streptococcus sp. sy004]